MNMQPQLHHVRLRPPFFHEGQGACLSRYLDPDFVNRFRQDVKRRQFSSPQFQQWQEEERHSRWDRRPVLRLPTHRAFHLVSCEAVCEQLGQPALDPERVTSAGFVIRRLTADGEQAWMLEDGEPLGWQPAPGAHRDPDLDRRLCANGVLHARNPNPAFNGEQTHPMHALPVTDEKGRRHTLLFGYVPLGGFYYQRDEQAPFAADSLQEASDHDAQSLSWPFGFRNAGNRKWQPEHGRPVDGGQPTRAMFDLLRLLVERYHLGEAERPENAALEALSRQLWFHDLVPDHHWIRYLQGGGDSSGVPPHYRRQTLLAYLQDCFAADQNPLVGWVSAQEDRAELGQDPAPLPRAVGGGQLDWQLSISADDADELRYLLGQRYQQQTLAQVREIPLPKFADGEQDVYRIIPFLRARNDHGKEQIYWGDSDCQTLEFRVASPFDPEASRSSLIPMPGLRDLRRGMARGASILTPGDTFDLINNLKLKKGISKDMIGSGPKAGIQWICSFSLPVITLVAMILLMVMISLLNIVFFWLPWVRICLPFPRINK